MKIELFKDTNFRGDVTFFITVDGGYVMHSATGNEKEALEMYDLILKNEGEEKRELIKQTEI